MGTEYRTVLVIAGMAAAALGGSPAAAAPAYPAKPVRVIVAYSPGGGADFVARITSARLSERLNQRFVVDNRGGASGQIGTEIAAKATPDGYTILLGQTGANAINQALFKNLPYDVIKDFAPITQVTRYHYIVALHPSVPAHSIEQLIALAKSHRGELTFGTPGPGSSAHLIVELFMRAAKIQLNHVPYRGSGPAVAATMAGHLTMTFGDVASTTPFVVSGKLRAIAVTGAKRLPQLPKVPTVSEAGLPGFEASVWHGYFAPAGTPREIVNKLYSELAVVLKAPDLRQRFAQDGIETVANTPEEFTAFLKKDVEKWSRIIRDAKITVE